MRKFIGRKIGECECLFGLLNLLNLVANRFVCVLTIADSCNGQRSAKGQKRPYTNHVRALKSNLEGRGNFENATCSAGYLNFRSIEHYLKRLQAGRFVRLEIV